MKNSFKVFIFAFALSASFEAQAFTISCSEAKLQFGVSHQTIGCATGPDTYWKLSGWGVGLGVDLFVGEAGNIDLNCGVSRSSGLQPGDVFPGQEGPVKVSLYKAAVGAIGVAGKLTNSDGTLVCTVPLQGTLGGSAALGHNLGFLKAKIEKRKTYSNQQVILKSEDFFD